MKARIAEDEEALLYHTYVTDSMQYLAQGKYVGRRWITLLDPKPADNRTGDEIAADVIRRAGLKQR